MQYPPKAPSPWPPRVLVIPEPEHPMISQRMAILKSRSGDHDQGWDEYLSMAEHTHLLAEAVREAKAQVWIDAGYAYRNWFAASNDSQDGYSAVCFKKASELRKGATPENGGKNDLP